MIDTTASRPLSSTGLRRLLDVVDQMLRRIRGRHAGIHEADQIGNRVIAEDHVHRGRAVLVAIDVVKLLGQIARAAVRCRPAQRIIRCCVPARLRRSPSTARPAVRDRQCFFRDAALRRPHSLRTHAENLLVQVETAPQLLARIFRMAKPVLWQRQAGRRNRTGVGIAKQRQNRMIERRRRNLDRSLLRRRGMRRQNSAQQSPSRARSQISDRRASK